MEQGQGLDGQFTSTVYGAIKDQRYAEAIQILEFERQNFQRSRAALSLLGHCYFMVRTCAYREVSGLTTII